MQRGVWARAAAACTLISLLAGGLSVELYNKGRGKK
jgi:hypothetical protein